MAENDEDLCTALASRLRVLFGEKFMADYRNTFRGELGRTQAEVLEYLYEHGSHQPNEIAAAIHIPKQHVSKIVRQFADIGFVSTTQSKQDRRACIVEITDSGRLFIDKHIEQSKQLAQVRINHLSCTEQKQLVDTMEALICILEKM